MPEPIYTPDNARSAFQLQWSYSLFWRIPPANFAWYLALESAVERDGLRLLNHHFEPPHTSQSLISTTPGVVPQIIAQRLKGRLQHLLKSAPDAFRRNYALRSVGSTKREKVEAYIDSQLGHHRMADERIMARVARFQFHNATVDLNLPQETAHARYWYNLHLVFVMRDRERHVQEETLAAIHDMMVNAAKKKGHRLSRAGILPDHIHMAVGCNLSESPEDVALSYMNNLAYAVGKPMFEYGYWVGTFGEYDLGALKTD